MASDASDFQVSEDSGSDFDASTGRAAAKKQQPSYAVDLDSDASEASERPQKTSAATKRKRATMQSDSESDTFAPPTTTGKKMAAAKKKKGVADNDDDDAATARKKAKNVTNENMTLNQQTNARPTLKKTVAAAPKQQKKKSKKDDSSDDASDLAAEEDGSDLDVPSTATAAAKAAKSGAGGATKKDGRAVEDIYQKKSPLEHILLRPDTYVGSIEEEKQQMWVYNKDTGSMEYRAIQFVPGFYKIFDEILVNAADNKQRDATMNTIKVKIDRDANVISVWNNGQGIPVKMHAVEKVWVPELIFGHLLTSSNYNDSEKKVTGGRNGYGAKLCNIFSTKFTVETADSASGKRYKQDFLKNMSTIKTPTITDHKKGEDFTKITFQPDLQRFGLTSITDDMEALMCKRIYDLAGVLPGVKVLLNDEKLKIKNFKEYIEMYLRSQATASASANTSAGAAEGDSLASAVAAAASEKIPIVHQIVSPRWEIAFAMSDGSQFQQVSFVNSICTSKGGTHVDHVTKQITDKLLEAILAKQKKGSNIDLKPAQIKNHMWLFINCLIENPAFDSQTKENMTLKQSSFGSKCDISPDFLTKIMRQTPILDTVQSWARFKQDQALKKSDGTKRSRISGILKLEDANDAGTKNGKYCTLILTEGDSAKATAVSGLGVVGRDRYGVFPLRGKLLNVRDANHKQIMENQEIAHIKQILGLQQGKKYTDVSQLRYGHVMIMADQDHDGSHIKGLIINLFELYWPELLTLKGFLMQFITPIVKVKKGTQELDFFTLPEYETWREETDKSDKWSSKYYKGLGTSSAQQAKGYFSNLDLHAKDFKGITTEDRALVDMAFNKKKADDRKEWLRQFEPGTYMDYYQESISISDFVNKELSLFSMADNHRSLPSMVDGLKPGLRKIVFSCLKKSRSLLRDEHKVFQLAAMVSSMSAYHHSEATMAMSIVGLAQNFVGSNNINYLRPIGQFGTRLQGGKDAASSRYIFTKLEAITRKIFHPLDDALLAYLNEEGQMVEPSWYIPILPMLLVNGSDGIGTGWSTSIPNYNPLDIVANLRRMLKGEMLVPMTPWYQGFKGTITPLTHDRYQIAGQIKKIDATSVEITELPIRVWTQQYKEYLEALVTGTEKTPALLKDYKEYHTDTSVHFILSMSEANLKAAEDEGLEKKFKLVTSVSTSNMTCFDQNGRIKKYNTAEELMEDFYHLRLTYYQKRKEHMVHVMTRDQQRVSERVRFIREVIEGTLNVRNRKRTDILEELKRKNYIPFPKETKERAIDEEDVVIDTAMETRGPSSAINNKDGEEDDEGGNDVAAQAVETQAAAYDYLLSMPILTLSKEKVEKLEAEKAELTRQLDTLLSTTIQELWIKDLDDFEAEYHEFLRVMREDASKVVTGKKTQAKGKKGKPLAGKKMVSSDTVANAKANILKTTSSKPSVPAFAKSRAALEDQEEQRRKVKTAKKNPTKRIIDDDEDEADDDDGDAYDLEDEESDDLFAPPTTETAGKRKTIASTRKARATSSSTKPKESVSASTSASGRSSRTVSRDATPPPAATTAQRKKNMIESSPGYENLILSDSDSDFKPE